MSTFSRVSQIILGIFKFKIELLYGTVRYYTGTGTGTVL